MLFFASIVARSSFFFCGNIRKKLRASKSAEISAKFSPISSLRSLTAGDDRLNRVLVETLLARLSNSCNLSKLRKDIKRAHDCITRVDPLLKVLNDFHAWAYICALRKMLKKLLTIVWDLKG